MKSKSLVQTAALIWGICCILSCRSEKAIEKSDLFDKENLLAWCIVPYDAKERTPQQRAKMLKELGVTKYAWDWREKHLSQLAEEIEAARMYDLSMSAVWFWVDGGSGEVLEKSNLQILKTLREKKLETELWVSFNNRFFDGLSDEECLQKGVAAIDEIHRAAKEINCTIALYNHGDWFGQPENQIRIIQALGKNEIGMVYNFHHAHEQIDEFLALLQKMKPYLSTVNLNGMSKSGPKILPIGTGDEEFAMLRILKASGFDGTIGVLGHIENEDVKIVLERNLAGLQTLMKRLE